MGSARGQSKYVPVVLAFAAAGFGFIYVPAITSGAIAAVIFGLALLCLVQDHLLARSGRRAQGTVVDFQAEEDCFIPIIEFQDDGGAIRRESTGTGLGVKKPPVGSRVVVIHDPAGKWGCEIDSFWRRQSVTLALLLLGAAFTAGAILSK
jgi:hypothetical protein